MLQYIPILFKINVRRMHKLFELYYSKHRPLDTDPLNVMNDFVLNLRNVFGLIIFIVKLSLNI